ncbi:MAG: DUF1080 domain-containing protein [Pirellulaceae bacterium]
MRAGASAVVGVLVILSGCAPTGGEQGGAVSVPTAVPAADQRESRTNATASVPPVTEAPRPLSDQELGEGWISLFDGRTLFGWKASSDAAWRVENETIVVDGGSPGLLCTTAQFGDYVLKVEYRCEANTNSGIFLHTPLQPLDPAKDCYELNIAPSDNPFPTCSLVKRVKAEGEFEGTDWQAFEVTVQGDHVGVKWNGKPVLDYTDPAPLRRGHIGLQLNQGRVAFRNIRLKPLGTSALFNGRDLTGWKEYPNLPSKFRVTPEGWLHVENGRGQLESAGSYGDFVFQLECISHAPQLNSGVFFRCIPGEEMNGYECQIHNGVKGGDRSQPMDCGTGGIFRRQDARLVVPNDLEWFHMTLVADRNHMAAWVNGYQVSDWTDDRPPHDNPRNGRRDAPGTLMLQGHDPTTNLSFRGLRLSEIPPRPQ